jgi:hypothetical protein
MNDCNGQVLPISERIVETRCNLNLARVITWQHDTRGPRRHHEWQQFTMRSKSRAGSGTILYNIHKVVRYRLTRWHIKLLSLWDPKKSDMWQYTTQTCSLGSYDRSLNDTGRGYHLRSSEFTTDLSPTFPSGILHFLLIALTSLKFCQHFWPTC